MRRLASLLRRAFSFASPNSRPSASAAPLTGVGKGGYGGA